EPGSGRWVTTRDRAKLLFLFAAWSPSTRVQVPMGSLHFSNGSSPLARYVPILYRAPERDRRYYEVHHRWAAGHRSAASARDARTTSTGCSGTARVSSVFVGLIFPRRELKD